MRHTAPSAASSVASASTLTTAPTASFTAQQHQQQRRQQQQQGQEQDVTIHPKVPIRCRPPPCFLPCCLALRHDGRHRQPWREGVTRFTRSPAPRTRFDTKYLNFPSLLSLSAAHAYLSRPHTRDDSRHTHTHPRTRPRTCSRRTVRAHSGLQSGAMARSKAWRQSFPVRTQALSRAICAPWRCDGHSGRASSPALRSTTWARLHQSLPRSGSRQLPCGSGP